MPAHYEIVPDPDTVALSLAQEALRLSRAQMTSVSGSAYWDNGDGTGTLIGDQTDGRPCLVDQYGNKMPLVDTSGIEQQAKDAAAKAQQAVENMEQVRKDAEEGVQNAKDAAAKADEKAQQAVDGMESVRSEAAKGVTEAKTAAASAQSSADSAIAKADRLEDSLDGTKAIVDQHTTKLGEVVTKVSNAQTTADSALGVATQAVQDAKEIKTTADRAYSDAQSALTQSSTLSQRADRIETSLETNYYDKTHSDQTYATKSSLQQTSDSITSTVERTYATKDALAALQNIADNAVETWTGTQPPTASNAPASTWTTEALRKQHAGDVYYDTTSGYAYRWGSDGKSWSWSLIKDTDIAKAIADAAKAQSSADKAQSGVDKLNTDLPVTYATKSEVRQTAESITSKVTEAARVGQTALDKATTVEQTAAGLQSTVSEQASTIKGHTTTIGQLTQRADSLSSTLTQTNRLLDSTLANMLANPGFETGDMTGWTVGNWGQAKVDSAGVTHSGSYRLVLSGATNGQAWVNSRTVPVAKGRVYEVACWAWSDDATQVLIGLETPNGAWSRVEVPTLQAAQTWVRFGARISVDEDHADAHVVVKKTLAAGKFLRLDDFTLTDVTDTAKAQSAADTAITRTSTLEQNLSGFKTEVAQTYETKTDSLKKQTTLQQNLDGFKSTVSSTYSTKSELSSVKTTADNAQPKVWHYTLGTNGQTGWFHVCQLKVTSDWANAAIRMTVSGRRAKQTDIEIQFQSVASTDPGLASLRRNGSCPVAIAKSATSTWELYVQKSEAYDALTVTNLLMPTYYPPTLTWKTDQVASLPSGAIQATEQIGSQDAATYTTKSEFTQTTTSISAKVTETATTAGNALSKATTVEQTAKSLQSTVSEQATTLKGHTSTLSTLSQKADSLSTSISQTNQKTDAALANGLELVRNPECDKSLGNLDGWSGGMTLSATGAPSGAPRSTVGKLTTRDTTGGSRLLKRGRTYRFSAWVMHDSTAKHTSSLGCTYTTADGNITWPAAFTAQTAQTSWMQLSGDLTIPSNAKTDAQIWFQINGPNGDSSTTGWYYTLVSVRDVTEAKAAQTTANTAITRTSTLEQNLNSFKITVGQTYETKTDSLAKKTALEQSLGSFKTTVSSTYATKTSLESYATKSQLSQTESSIKTTVSETYASKTTVQNLSTSLTQTKDSLTASIKQAQSTASTANGNATNAQNRVGSLETCIKMTTDGVRVGTIKNGAFNGYSALVNANGSFDVLNASGAAVAKFDSNGIRNYANGTWYMAASGYKSVAAASNLPSVKYERDVCLVTGENAEYVYHDGKWRKRQYLVQTVTFTDKATSPWTYVWTEIFYDCVTGLVTLNTMYDEATTVTGLTGAKEYVYGSLVSKLLLPAYESTHSRRIWAVSGTTIESYLRFSDGAFVLRPAIATDTKTLHYPRGTTTYLCRGGAWIPDSKIGL